MAENPYYVGDVISDEKFFVGRHDIVRDVMEVLPSYAVTMIHGQRRIGKSSILARLEASLRAPGSQFIPVSIDLAGRLGKSVDRLALEFSKTIRRKCSLSIPPLQPGEGAGERFRSKWLPEAISEVLVRKAYGIVLLLDEFDDVALNFTSPASEFYKFLGEILQATSYGLRVVVVLGRDPTQLLEPAQDMLARARQFHVSLMTRKEIGSLIDLSKDTLKWSEDAREALWDLTHGHPCISQLICSKIWYTKSQQAVKGKKTAIERRDVEEAFSYEEYGHIIDEAWAILLPEEQVIVCYIASKAKLTHEDDILNFIEEMELADSYEETTLYEFLQKLNNSDWTDQTGNYYGIKVPIYRQWVREHYELRDLVNKLFNNQEKAISLALQAEHAKDLPDAIRLLERSFRLDPDNEDTLTDLTGHFKQFIDLCIKEGNNKQALEYASRLSRVDPELGLKFHDRVEARVQSNLISQKIDSLLRQDDFPEAVRQLKRLDRYDPGKGDLYQLKIIQRRTGFVARHWLNNLLFWFPTPLVAITLSQNSFPTGSDFSLGFFHWFIILLTVLPALAAAILSSYKLQDISRHITALFFIVGTFYTVLGVLLVPDIAFAIRILTVLCLGGAVFLMFSPSRDIITRTSGALANLIFLMLLCFSGDFLSTLHNPATAAAALPP
ncbi:MAG TPA: AAA-like domain-containing protein, partial [Anaerolineales bacterium]|nr:AAA-like domain-containing protein [Anaerolineales bacterium]